MDAQRERMAHRHLETIGITMAKASVAWSDGKDFDVAAFVMS